MMNKELILKAIQNPKIVRLIYRALAEDPGPLRRYGDGAIPDNSVYCAVIVYLDRNGKQYSMAAFDDVSIYLHFGMQALHAWMTGEDNLIETDTISLLLSGGTNLLSNMRWKTEQIADRKTAPVPNAGLSLVACLSADIPATAPVELAEMTRLFRGEAIDPATELGQAILALAEK